jgi:hypothetical protein
MGFDASVNGKVVMSDCQAASAVPVLQMYDYGVYQAFAINPEALQFFQNSQTASMAW